MYLQARPLHPANTALLPHYERKKIRERVLGEKPHPRLNKKSAADDTESKKWFVRQIKNPSSCAVREGREKDEGLRRGAREDGEEEDDEDEMKKVLLLKEGMEGGMSEYGKRRMKERGRGRREKK